MCIQSLSINDIKKDILKYHADKGFTIYRAFPLVTKDRTVMFTNAAMTPLKNIFDTDASSNYALNQMCFRLGGSFELASVGNIPYYSTIFEMFGSGILDATYEEGIEYLFELLDYLKIDSRNLYFVVGPESDFRSFIIKKGVPKARIITIHENGLFLHEWVYGNPGLVGNGITVVFSRSNTPVTSMQEMEQRPDDFVGLLTFTYVYGKKTANGELKQISSPGFELGMGLERLMAVKQGCNCYQTIIFQPLIDIVKSSFPKLENSSDELMRKLGDHYKAAFLLIAEGLSPSNKKHGYALRKILRRICTLLWSEHGYVTPIGSPVDKICQELKAQGYDIANIGLIKTTLKTEAKLFIDAISRGKREAIKKHLSSEQLANTYGLPQELISINLGGEINDQ